MWDISGGWKETDKILRGFFKKILGLPKFSANRAAEIG
jgi:hypothetical protein